MVPTRTEKEEKRESNVKKTQISICARGSISFVSHRSGKEVRPQHALSKVSNWQQPPWHQPSFQPSFLPSLLSVMYMPSTVQMIGRQGTTVLQYIATGANKLSLPTSTQICAVFLCRCLVLAWEQHNDIMAVGCMQQVISRFLTGPLPLDPYSPCPSFHGQMKRKEAKRRPHKNTQFWDDMTLDWVGDTCFLTLRS